MIDGCAILNNFAKRSIFMISIIRSKFLLLDSALHSLAGGDEVSVDSVVEGRVEEPSD